MRRHYLILVSLLLLFVVAGCRSRLDLNQASTQMNVGLSAARQNLWREALFRFERAVRMEPENAMAHNNLAVAYEGVGEFEKARAAYTEALRLDKSNQYIQRNYSRFVEFYSRNRKREQPLSVNGENRSVSGDEDSETEAAVAATPPMPAEATPADAAQPSAPTTPSEPVVPIAPTSADPPPGEIVPPDEPPTPPGGVQ